MWAHVVTAYEEAFNRDAHRHTDPSRAAYLQHLRALGYDLTDVEQRSIDNAAPDPLPGTGAHPDDPPPPAGEQPTEAAA